MRLPNSSHRVAGLGRLSLGAYTPGLDELGRILIVR